MAEETEHQPPHVEIRQPTADERLLIICPCGHKNVFPANLMLSGISSNCEGCGI
jgi:hypothetical protein